MRAGASTSQPGVGRGRRHSVGRIEQGWLVLLGVAQEDSRADAEWLAEKILNLRGFEDDQGKMNLSVVDVRGGILVVSQFTLLADCRSGRRPSFTAAAKPPVAEELYLFFAKLMKSRVSGRDRRLRCHDESRIDQRRACHILARQPPSQR